MKTPLFNPVLRHGLLLLSLAALLCGLSAGATTPQYMTYQGYLTDQNGTPLATNGPANYSVAFRIWNQPTGTSGLLYGELQTVTVNNGYFSVLLGQGTTYNPGTPDPQPPLSTVFTTNTGAATGRYVELTVKGINGGQDVTLLPRLQLIASPYAFLAAGASALVDGTSGANVISSSGNNVSVSGAVSATSFTGNSVSVSGAITANSFAGNGSGLTSLNAADLIGQVPAASLSGVALLANGNVFTQPQTINASGNLGQADLRLIAGAGNVSRATRLDFLNAPASSSVPQWTMINDYNQSGVNDLRFINDTGNAQMSWLQNGNVGIGTTTPGATLTIQQSNQRSEALRLSGTEYYAGDYDTQGISFLMGVNRLNNRQLWITDSAQVQSPNSNNAVIRIMPNASTIDSVATDGNTLQPLHLGDNTALTLLPNGNVGIGTTSPAEAALEVDSYVSHNIVITSVPISIWAAEYVYGAAFESTSDERIKNIKGQSDSAADLKTLLGIKITDFTYKDTNAKGNRAQKKVIAQQVEQVYPQATSQNTGVVPDIYANAPVKDGWVQLATDLKVGDRVKLIGEKEKGVHEVLEVRAGAFRTDFKPATDKVFVYGREVKDLRAVDYDAIAMLNVSATQELAKRLEKVEARQAHVAELEQKSARVDALEQEVGDLKKLVAQLAADSKSAKLAAASAGSGHAAAEGRQAITTASLGN